MKLLMIISSILLFGCFSYGQNAGIERLVQEGIELHDAGEYEHALEKYKNALEIDPNSSLVNYEISYTYFFLLIEPNTQRAGVEYQTLRNYIDYGVSQTSDHNINVVVPMNEDSDFGAADLMISLSKASSSLEENKGKTPLLLFAESNESLFKILGELKKDNTGFWWDFYVPFFYSLANDNLTETYSYYISQTLGEEVTKWFDEHPDELEKFKVWMSEY